MREELCHQIEKVNNMSRRCALLVCALGGLCTRVCKHSTSVCFHAKCFDSVFRTSGMMIQTYQHTLSTCVRPSNGQQLIIDLRICTDTAPRLRTNLNRQFFHMNSSESQRLLHGFCFVAVPRMAVVGLEWVSLVLARQHCCCSRCQWRESARSTNVKASYNLHLFLFWHAACTARR